MTEDLEPDSEIAFERSDNYQWRGTKLNFSRRHYYAALAIANAARMSPEEQVLLAFWVSTHTEDEIRDLRGRWRSDPESVHNDIEDVPDRFDITPNSEEMIEVAAVVEDMWQDVSASKDTPDLEDEEGEATGPGK